MDFSSRGFPRVALQSIIECLRYAASNDMPPNSKSSFVHDPKVTLTSLCVNKIFHDYDVLIIDFNFKCLLILMEKYRN